MEMESGKIKIMVLTTRVNGKTAWNTEMVFAFIPVVKSTKALFTEVLNKGTELTPTRTVGDTLATSRRTTCTGKACILIRQMWSMTENFSMAFITVMGF